MQIEKIDKSNLSPMMNQYCNIKENYKDHILFFRLGDFYEMFFDDAITVSRTLELTLTGKDCGLSERAPMCGIPYHSSEVYIKKLVDLGYKVAICEQLTNPSESKGIVQRDVVKIVTPGTLIESSMLDDSSNNYLCCAYLKEKTCSLCFADISTAEVIVLTCAGKEFEQDVINELSRYNPAEIIFNSDFLTLKRVTDFIKIRLNCSVTLRDDICFNKEFKSDIVYKQFSVNSFEELDVFEENHISSICCLFDYISETQKLIVNRFTAIKVQSENLFMGLDLTARRNLELTETLRNKEKRGSLLWVLDSTKTSMGKRLLKSYIEQPLLSPVKIMDRLYAVESLIGDSIALMELTDLLNNVYDIERLMTRIMYKTATPRDLKSLSITSKQLPFIKEQLDKLSNSRLIKKLDENIFTLEEINKIIEDSIIDEPPVSVKDGGVIKDGFNSKLDELRNIITNGNEIIEAIELKEKEKTGIKGLKIGYNRIFGYYIEVTRSYYNLVPDSYIRKQTLANCERFITQELKDAENTILGAKDKALVLEDEIYNEVRDYIATKVEIVQKTASSIANIDVLCSFANVSIKNQYTKPDIIMDGSINVKDGRHPVVELMLENEVFVPNDIYLDIKYNKMSIITGPNMSGKSTYMRQTALIVLMAQIGCFVPAKHASISIVDKIFTRVGASDDLTAGQSTFMVEMSEVADILKNATNQSLVILDEVGRGTSTFDGISIARAVAEHICLSKKLGCKTLFATHYHELIELENTIEGIKNYSVAVKKKGSDIKFLRKIVSGGVDDSYGIEVAKLAGVPHKVIDRARNLLEEMELNSQKNHDVKENEQISFTTLNREKVVDRLTKTNVDELSDFECREFLQELIKML